MNIVPTRKEQEYATTLILCIGVRHAFLCIGRLCLCGADNTVAAAETEAPLSSLPHTFEATIYFPADMTSSTGSVIIGNYSSTSKESINFEVTASGNPRLYLLDEEGSASLAAEAEANMIRAVYAIGCAAENYVKEA
ncbi:MAG: hypothetical protein IJ009_00665 [Clostridia bacterium]|nr:hypothetical protein [Clostridia bacterium]